MRELERLATIAARVLADVATGQPVQDPRTEGAHMSDPQDPLHQDALPDDQPRPATEATR